MWCHKYWIERRNYLCVWADCTSANTAQYLEAFYCKGTLFWVMFSLFMLSSLFQQSCFLARQSPACSGPWGDFKRFRTLFPFEYHMFSASTFLQVVEVNWSGSLAFQHVPYSPQFDAICKLSENVFFVLAHVGAVKQHCSWWQHAKNVSQNWPAVRIKAILLLPLKQWVFEHARK